MEKLRGRKGGKGRHLIVVREITERVRCEASSTHSPLSQQLVFFHAMVEHLKRGVRLSLGKTSVNCIYLY